MLQRPNGPTCANCVLEKLGWGFSEVAGTGTNGVLMVGESSGKNEAQQGIPFIGPAGFLLGRALQRVGIPDRNVFKITNVIRCQPPGNELLRNGKEMPWTAAAIAQCAPNLDRVIEEMKPKAIVALGEVPLRRILDMRGIGACRGYAFWSKQYACWVVPTFHPSFIQRGKRNLQPVMAGDIKKAVRIAAEGYAYDEPTVIIDPSPEAFGAWTAGYERALGADPELPLAADIETPYKRGRDEDELSTAEEEERDPTSPILRISFAYGPDEAVTVPWDAAWIPGVQRLLGGTGTKIFWNGRTFDVRRLRANGIRINGIIRDSMIAWHVLNSDLPKKLGFVTPTYWWGARMWKHLAESEPEYYNGVDSIANWRNDRGIVRDLKATGMWHVYLNQVERLDPVLDRMSEAGMLIDVEARDKLRAYLVAEIEKVNRKMQEIVPKEIRDLQVYAPGNRPSEQVLAKLEPEDEVIEVEGTSTEQTCGQCGAHPVRRDHVTRKTLPEPERSEPQSWPAPTVEEAA